MHTDTSAEKLKKMIQKAIEDHRITNAEYEDILMLANEDGIIDPRERALLATLQEMIAEKTVKRVP